MIELCDEALCSGCMACYSVCPHNAIKIKIDDHGFKVPKIDSAICLECKACQKVCPVLSEAGSFIKNQKGWAAWSLNETIRRESSSGGLFYELANYIISKGGIVYGAAFDEYMNVIHIGVDNLDGLNKLMGSKYVQSDISLVFKEIKQKLVSLKVPILFSGTPCQVDGLKHFLRKDYDNLFTIDLVCHGVPSPKMWNKYVNYVSEKYNSKLLSYKFRWKKVSWTFYHSRLVFENGKIVEYDWFRDVWLRLFLNNKGLRESCYNCRYTSMNRVSDITLADFWGYQSERKDDRKTDKGISLVLCNSDGGKELFESVRSKIKCFPRSLEVIEKTQQSLSHPWKKPEDTLCFWEDYRILPFDKFLGKYYHEASANDIGSFLAKYGMPKLGLFIRWKIIGKVKKCVKRILLR